MNFNFALSVKGASPLSRVRSANATANMGFEQHFSAYFTWEPIRGRYHNCLECLNVTYFRLKLDTL